MLSNRAASVYPQNTLSMYSVPPNNRQFIKLDSRGQLPSIIYLDQISSVISMGLTGTKIVLKEIINGKNVEYVFPMNFEFIEEEILKADQHTQQR